jgi:hypothetical protein
LESWKKRGINDTEQTNTKILIHQHIVGTGGAELDTKNYIDTTEKDDIVLNFKKKMMKVKARI